MELLATRKLKQLWFHRLLKPYEFEKPFPDLPYVCMLLTFEPDIPTRDKFSLCNQLVRTDCRYAVCGGDECESWHDEIDDAYLYTDPDFSPPDDRMIMTTWHTGKSVSDIIFFGLNCTNFGDFKFKRYLVLSIGSRDGLREQVLEAVRAEWDESNLLLDHMDE